MQTVKVKSRSKVESQEFAPGDYYVGDPCYVLTRPQWDAVLKQCIDDTNQCYDGEFIVNCERMFMASTAYGDGGYRDNIGNEYGVDSGTLGVVPVSILNPQVLKKAIDDKLGIVKTMNSPFIAMSDNGVFELVSISDKYYLLELLINTRDEFNDSEYEPDDY